LKKQVTCIYKQQKWKFYVGEHVSIQDLHDYMEKKKYIPKGLFMRRIHGCPSFPEIDDWDEFYEDIPDMPELYGCPTAKEIPGIVPDCMLMEFDGYTWEEWE